MDNARDVIAPELVEAWRNGDKVKTRGTLWCFPEDRHKNLVPGGMLYEKFANILAALNAAGFEIVKRDAPLPPTPGPFNPFGKQDDE